MTFSRRTIFIALFLAGLALLPVALADQPFYVGLLSRAMILSIAAISLNLLLGYGNMISFGHAVYIGIGAYSVGIFAYYEIYDGFIQWPVGLAVSALVALLFGAISLRTKGVYFIMITLALAQMLYFLGVSVDEYGADDGLVIDVRSEFAGLIDLEEGIALYYVIFFFLLLTIFIVHKLVHSRFGIVLRGAKSNEARLLALGFPVYRYKLMGFVIAGVICGLAGLLLGNFTNFVNPDMMHWTRSGELIFMVVLGGLGSLFGPVLGAFAFLLLEEILSDFTIHWQIIFGPFLILAVLFLRGGINSLLGSRSDG
ncbi:MAG: branched-chain amino acid ABC transporter permease [Alphaproteobacteria bacterium]|nr:branched-chain amino acid ABC transporter permease [Alphaproteobacteria bacterium]